MRPFIIKLAKLYLFLGAACGAIFWFGFKSHFSIIIPFLFIYFFVVNVVVFKLSCRIKEQSNAKFYRSFSLITILKFFGSSIVFVFVIALNKQHTIPLVIVFFCLYVVSLIFEVRELNSYMSKIIKK